MKRKSLIVLVILVAITFCSALRIQSAQAVGIVYIEPDGSISPPEAPIQTLDRIKYSLTANADASIIIQRSNIVINGASYTLQGDGTQNGFILQDVVNITIKNTLIIDCFDGIQLFNASDNTITGNTIIGSAYEGVSVYYSSGNVVAGNNITNNQIGIAVYSSSSNSIVHNDFMDNVYQFYIESSNNNWDNGYPSGGNFWSDYNGTDSLKGPDQNQPGSDAIGDTPYTCDPTNMDNYPLMNPWINVAITDVSSSKFMVGGGYKVYINVTVQNQGWNAQTTNLRVYVNTTILATVTNLALAARSQVILNFTWQTMPAQKGNYIISSTADAVPNEPDTTDNNRAYGRIVKVTIVGDVNGDGSVNILDAIVISTAYGALPGGPNWNGNADINGDNVVNILDAIILSVNYGKKA